MTSPTFLYALDAENGALIWRAGLRGAILSSPAVLNDLVYVGSSDGRLYALRRGGGELAWSFQVGGRVWTSPAVIDGRVYFGSHDGFIYAIEGE